jgi:hypothetical protein
MMKATKRNERKMVTPVDTIGGFSNFENGRK